MLGAIILIAKIIRKRKGNPWKIGTGISGMLLGGMRNRINTTATKSLVPRKNIKVGG